MNRDHAVLSPSPAASADAAARRHPAARGWALAFAAALVLYCATAATTVQWQDYGHFVHRIVDRELVTYLGLALSHPLHYWLSRAAVAALPVEPPHAVSLASALFGAVAVANVFGIVRLVTGRNMAAFLAAAGLGLAHTWWRMSTMPECYTVSVAAFTAEVWALVLWDRTRRPVWLMAMFAAGGLGLANHNLALLTLPVAGVVLLMAWRREVTWRAVLACAAAWLIGASLYLGLVIQQMIATGEVGPTIHSALFGSGFRDSVTAVRLPLRHMANSAAFTLLSFPNLTLPLAVLGLVRARRGGLTPLSRGALTAALAIHLVFVLRYDVIDQYTFLLPAYALLAVFAGIGAAAAEAMWTKRRAVMATALVLLALTPVLYLVAAPVARQFNALRGIERHKPYRDDYRYLFVPWGIAHQSAERMSRQAADLAAPDGLLIVEDGMARFAVQYQLTQRRLAGIELHRQVDPDAIEAARAAGRPVVLVPARTTVPPPPPAGAWQRIGDLYLLAP